MAEFTFTDANFHQTITNTKTPVVVDFWAEWCGPCRIISPLIEELAKEYEGKVLVGKLNVDENPQIAEQLGVMSIPTVKVFVGGKEVESVIGASSKDKYKKMIDNALTQPLPKAT